MKKALYLLTFCLLIISCQNKTKVSSDIEYNKSDTSAVLYIEQGYPTGSDGEGGIIVGKSFESILQMSKEGDMKAQYSLAKCFQEGKHVKQSNEKWTLELVQL